MKTNLSATNTSLMASISTYKKIKMKDLRNKKKNWVESYLINETESNTW